jgi:hypothetical protein
VPCVCVHRGKDLCVLCVCVCPQVIIGAPSVISEDLLRTFNIKLVVRGSVTETRKNTNGDTSRCGPGQGTAGSCTGGYDHAPWPRTAQTSSACGLNPKC